MIKMDTKQRLLDSAERLFAERGVDGTSLRAIIEDAKVNLAAIHYHYHSKEDLLNAVLLRRLEPVNRSRLEMLELCGEKPTLEAVLEAFYAPALGVATDPMKGGKPFVRLMGRIIADGDQFPKLVKEHFGVVLNRFMAALHVALPELPEAELFWKMHFGIGAMAHTLRSCNEMELISGGLCDTSDVEGLTRRLVSFVAGGFRA